MESEMDVKPYPPESSSSLSAGADEEKEKAEEKNNPSVMEEVENEMEPVKPDPPSEIPSSSSGRADEKKKEETEEEKEKQSNEMEPVKPDPSSDIPSSSSARADEKRKGKMEEKEDKEEKKRKRKEKKQDKKNKKRTSSSSLPTTKANREVRKTIAIHSPIVTTVDATIIVRQIKKITTTITLPPPPEPEMHKHKILRSLYLCIASHDQNISSQWYKINPYTKLTPNPQITTLHAFCSMPTPSPRNFQPVSGGLRVYTFGGICGSDEPPAPAPSFVCDLTTQNPVWQLLHPMQSSKLTPAAALSPSDNRIYVFGSSSLDPKPCPWGEVYDPSSDSWETFLSSAPPPPPPPKPASSTSPPHHTCRISHSLFLPNRQELLVFSYDHSYYWIHAFNFTTKTWKSVISHSNKKFRWVTSAAVGDFLYLNYDSYLWYIDLTQPKASLQPVYAFGHLAKKHMYLGASNRYLSYLGNGKLCMLTASPSHKPGWTSIKCFKFWVGMSHHTKIAKATAVFCSSDEYIAQGDYLESCLTI